MWAPVWRGACGCGFVYLRWGWGNWTDRDEESVTEGDLEGDGQEGDVEGRRALD